ncbi:hypothetical protein HDU93_000884 [Gonapodya sp. JEL0774]|nr:hypothetical protein HDU93_000884 [Gonapodya sp. JEL0774]
MDMMLAQSPYASMMTPEMREQMRTMMSNPESLRTMLQTAAQLGPLMNPGAGGLGMPALPGTGLQQPPGGFVNPWASLATPPTGSATTGTTGATAGTTGAVTGSPTGTSSPGSTMPGGGAGVGMPNPAMWNALMQGMAQGGGGLGGLGGIGAGLGQPADARPPEERFASQLQQLRDMGFFDAQENVRALLMAGGSVEGAVEVMTRDNEKSDAMACCGATEGARACMMKMTQEPLSESPESPHIFSMMVVPVTGKRPREDSELSNQTTADANENAERIDNRKRRRMESDFAVLPPLPEGIKTADRPKSKLCCALHPDEEPPTVDSASYRDGDHKGPETSKATHMLSTLRDSNSPSSFSRHHPRPSSPPQRRRSSRTDFSSPNLPRPIPARLLSDAAAERELASQRSRERIRNDQGSGMQNVFTPTDQASDGASRLRSYRNRLVEKAERTLKAYKKMAKLARQKMSNASFDTSMDTATVIVASVGPGSSNHLQFCGNEDASNTALRAASQAISSQIAQPTTALLEALQEEAQNLRTMLKRLRSVPSERG